jgi:hypothetical protein
MFNGSSPLADVGQFAERLSAKLLLVIDIAGGRVEFVVADQDVRSAALSQAKNDSDRVTQRHRYT